MDKARQVRKKQVKKWTAAIWTVAILVAGVLIFTNAAILNMSGQGTVSVQEARETGADYILVLGAKVDGDVPSVILQNRMEKGIELYREGAAPKLLLTGDGGQNRYDEISVMQKYALDAGVNARDILLDRDGFNTYASIYRAKAVYGIKNVLIVTQPYHMSRALYDARALGLSARGVEAAGQDEGQWFRDLREVAARAKDFTVCLFKPVPRDIPG